MFRPALALAAALATLAACDGGSNTRPTYLQLEPVPVEGAPVRGPADAWVTIVEFADFQCPYCEAMQPNLALLLASHPDDVRVVFRHFPLPAAQHPRARPAAIAAECAGEQGYFWETSDELWAGGFLDDAALAAAAEAGGVPDLDLWTACLGTAAPGERVDADVALGVEHGVGGVPAFFFNGEKIVGALDFDTLDGVYLAARARAVASGVPRESYYDVVVLGR